MSSSAARLRAVPAWAWLAGIVVASALVRALLAHRLPGPFIVADELIYSELAKSFAASGHFLVRGVATGGYGLVYPVLISPAYRAFRDLPQAYAMVKAVNSVLMSLAAVPAYLLARRVLPRGLSLLAALLTVAVPSMVYTGTVMTENVFYPLFLVVALALVAVLERPTRGRQLLLLALVLVAYETRAQSLAFAPAVLVAPLLLAWLAREPLRRAARTFAPLYGIALAGGVLVVGGQLARGESLGSLLGAYSVVGSTHYDVRDVADFALWHAADLDLYLGVVPLAATALLLVRARHETRPVQALLVATATLAVAFTVEVAAFATHFASDRLHERNLFQLAPLFLVATLVWGHRLDGGLPRRPALETAIVTGAALLPLTIPFGRFVGDPARADTLALLPVWTIDRHYLAGSALLTVGLVCAVLGSVALAARRGAGLALGLVALAWFALLFDPVFAGPHGFERSSRGAVFQGIRGVDRDWVDRAVPRGAAVAAVFGGLPLVDRFTVVQNEFFSRSVGTVYYLRTTTLNGAAAETRIRFGRDGLARTDDGRLVRPRYVLLDGSIVPDGVRVARDPALDVSVWRLRGPLLQTVTVTGVYPDKWSGADVTWLRRHCRGGELRVTLYSDPNFYAPTTVAADGGAGAVAVHVARDGKTVLQVRLPATAATCRVRFHVTPVRVPGKGDPRALGTHFDVFDYRPAR